MKSDLSQPENYETPRYNHEGSLDGTGLHIGVVVSRFNDGISKRLLMGCVNGLKDNQATDPDVYWVPGAYEAPLMAKSLASSGRYQAIICLGSVIKGDTAHFDFVAGMAAKGIMDVGLETGIPVIFGILTTDTLDQALERAKEDKSNKGYEAAETAIEMANLLKKG
ncbi:6,7-dimethyl-8-ribityllumazine synthase [Candidatus Marinamargulisbacteria bacterium SCGC AG-439-L15]|nr:6,7-dimethyl-8-ribityllumazine synthase [Candidatus Marinamargulisbacteria bacterium SCGC AG-439-L15]